MHWISSLCFIYSGYFKEFWHLSFSTYPPNFTFFFNHCTNSINSAEPKCFYLFLQEMSNILLGHPIVFKLLVSHRFQLWLKERGIARRYLWQKEGVEAFPNPFPRELVILTDASFGAANQWQHCAGLRDLASSVMDLRPSTKFANCWSTQEGYHVFHDRCSHPSQNWKR